MASGIYQITIGPKRYVGQAVNIKRRWTCHRRELAQRIHPNDELQYWHDLGYRPEFMVLVHAPRWQLDALEALWGRLLSNTEQRLPRLRWSSYLPAFCVQTIIDWFWCGLVAVGTIGLIKYYGY
jgi:hypothetical protein